MRPAMSMAQRSSDRRSPPVLALRHTTRRVASEAARARVSERLNISEKWLECLSPCDCDSAPPPSPCHCTGNGSLPLPQCARGACAAAPDAAVAACRSDTCGAIGGSGGFLKVQSGNIAGLCRLSMCRGDVVATMLPRICILSVIYRRTPERGRLSGAAGRSCLRMA